jgi:hypothetical protein
MTPLGKLLIAAGAVLIAAGVLVLLAGRLGIPLGRLPGDLHLGGKGWSFSFPVVTCLLLSAVLTLAMWFLRR